MRVRFDYTVDVSDTERRIIAAYNDDDDPAADGRRAIPTWRLRNSSPRWDMTTASV